MSWRTQGFADRDAIARIPSWLNPLAQALPSVQSSDVTRFVPIDGSGRHAAVLVLFGDGPDVLLIERARGADAHSGQPAFPGGVAEPVDVDAASTALREANEETGLRTAGVTVFGALPDLWVPVSDFVVSPILAWWHAPSPGLGSRLSRGIPGAAGSHQFFSGPSPSVHSGAPVGVSRPGLHGE